MAPMKPESKTIKIDMLGKFSIQRGESVLIQTSGKTKQVWLLIEYLIANRSTPPKIDQLIGALWFDSRTCTDPMNALKNLVYRARDLLKKELRDSETDFILYSNGCYLWNPDLNCRVDTEEFERTAQQAAMAGWSRERRIALYRQALDWYGGDFLPNSSYAPWAITRRKSLTAAFLECVRSLCLLFEEAHEYEELVALCESAIRVAPFEEALHKTLLAAYLSTGQNNKALAHYQSVTELFYRELGIDLSHSLRRLYRQMIKTVHQSERDLSVIKEELQEDGENACAYFCDYEIFKNLYRIQARGINRTGQSIIVALLSLSDDEGALVNGTAAIAQVNLFRDSILRSLRRGDAVSAYSAAQFIVMLPLTNLENAEMVMRRIIRRFESAYKRKDMKIIYTIRPVEPMEQ